MKSTAIRAARSAFAFAASLAAMAAPALAHHMEDGQVPDSFASGLLSGLGHPVIGLDHFAFIAGVGLAAAFLPRGLLAIAAFVGATAAGCGLHLAGVEMPFAELVIAASVLAVGAAVMSGRTLPLALAALLFALAGLFNGHAYGGSIIGAEQTPLAAYLIGFCAMQIAIAAGFMIAGRAIAAGAAAMATPARLAGAVIAGVGLTFLVQNVQSIVIPAPAPTETPAA